MLVVLLVAVSERPCEPLAYPPFLPNERASHGETRYMAYGGGAMLCCDGRWGWSPMNTRAITRIARNPEDDTQLYAILDPHKKDLHCAPS